MSSLMIYQIPRRQDAYHRKRILFYQLACRTELDYLLICYDAKYTGELAPAHFSGWAPNVRLLNYDHVIRRHVDFSKPDFLEETLSNLADYLNTHYRGIHHVYSYLFRQNPLVKILMWLIQRDFPQTRIVQTEDGLYDYALARFPDLFQEPDPYTGSPFEDTPYRRFFSNRLDFLDSNRFDYALFHPELVRRNVSHQVPISEYFDFIGRASQGRQITNALILVPQTYEELLWLDQQVARCKGETRFALLNQGGFHYQPATVDQAAHIGPTPLTDFQLPEGLIPINGLLPMEYMNLTRCRVVSNHSSVLYRLARIHPEVETTAIVPEKRFEPWYFTHGDPLDQPRLDALSEILEMMDIPVIRAAFEP